MERNKKTFIIVGIILIILILVVAAFGYYRIAISQQRARLAKENLIRSKNKNNKPVEVTIQIYNDKIVPSNFKIQAGRIIDLTVVSMEGKHSFFFENKNLSAIKSSFSQPGQTYKISFYAPDKKREYSFICTGVGDNEEKITKGMMVID